MRVIFREPCPLNPMSPKPHVPMSNPKGVWLFWVADLIEPCPDVP